MPGTMLPDLKGKRFVIFGLQGSGKTVLLKHILKSEPAHLIFDVKHEYQGFNRYVVRYRDDRGIPELDALINQVVIPTEHVKLFAIDEANRYLKPRVPMPPAALNLNDFSRRLPPTNKALSFGCIARRPVQLHTDITELAHFMFCFNLRGKNDCEYLNAISAGLGDAVATLAEFHFVIVSPNRSYLIHPPVPFIP